MKGRVLLYRRATIILILLMLPLLISSCKDSDQVLEAPVEDRKYEKHITFTINTVGADNAGKDADGNECKVFGWLKDKYNFDFKWVPCTYDDLYLEKPLLWFASGTEPDLIVLDVAPSRYSYFLQWVKNGKLQPYPEFGERWPNLQKAWDKAVNGKKFAIDGKVYAYPAFTDTAQYNFLNPPWGRVYRIDWAEAVGLRTPDDVYTFEQWNNLIKEVIEKDPGGNGPNRTIGQIVYDWMIPGGFGTFCISPNITKYVKINGEWVWGPQLPESLEMVKLMKSMYDQGIIWKDQIIVKSDDIKNKLLSDEAFSTSLSSNPASLDRLYEDYLDSHPGSDPTKIFGIAYIKGPDGKFFVKQSSDHWTETGISTRLGREKVERWCDILDYLVSEEGYYMRNFGIPGEDWILENGKPVLLWPKDENGNPKGPTGLIYERSWPWAGRGGNSDVLMSQSPIYSEWARNLIKKGYSLLENEEELFILPFDIEQNYFTGPNYAKVGTLEREIIKQFQKILVSDDVERDWNEWLEEMEPIVRPVLDELNANLN